MKEIWKDIPEFEGLYQISNLGRIMSFPRKGGFKNKTILKNGKSKKNYAQISLSENGKKTCKKIHRLVAQAFIPNPENKPEINHKDGVKANNHVDNLEWCTNQENIDHAIKNGLRGGLFVSGSKHFKALFCEEEVLEIRDKYKNFEYSQKELAERYRVSKSAISSIIHRRSWKHI